MLICITCSSRSVLRWITRNRYKLSIIIAHQHLIVERRFFFHHRVNMSLHVLCISRKLIIFPTVLKNPRNACRRPSPVKYPARVRPSVRVVLCMRHKSVFRICFRTFNSCVNLRRNTSRLSERIYIVDQRFCAFRHIRRICRPVVHLQIDIHMIVRMPCGVIRSDPDSLQVRRKSCSSFILRSVFVHRSLSRWSHRQITSVLEEHQFQITFFCFGSRSFFICLQQLIRCLVRHCLSDVKI